MSDIISEAIVAILGADIALVIAFLAYISPKYNQYIIERRELLDQKLKARISESKTTEITMETFLPLFEEYETTKNWGKTLKQILVYLGYSILLVIIGLFFCLFGSIITLGDIPVEVVFVIGGGFYFLSGLGVIIRHAIEVNEWKVSKKN